MRRAGRPRERRGPRSLSLRGVATVAGAFGVVAVGAFAIGALAVRRLSIRRVLVGSARFGSLEIDELAVRRQSDDLVMRTSAYPPAETVERLEAAIREKGIALFARIDHSGGAAAAGMPLRFTQLLIFGNPKAGTPLMQSRQTIGIDLPLRLLVWEDERGDVMVGYEDPGRVAVRHGVADRPEVVNALSTLLAALAVALT